MKKLLALLLAAVMLLCCCVGCGQKKPDVSDPVTPGGDVSTSTTTTQGDESADTTTGTDDQTTDASDGTTTEGDPTADTTDTQGTTKPSDNKTTKPSDNKTTKPSDNKTTKTSTTTTTKSRVTGMFVSTTSSSGGGITLPTQNGGDKGYEFDPGDEWTLFWNDEFTGTELDATKWNVGDGKTDNSYRVPKNVKVDNGVLILSARRENYKDRPYTTSSVTTARKFSFQYGRLEFRARLTYGQGLHPALWTMGDSYLTTSDELGWPVCGEIDVMEMTGRGSESEKYTQKANSITTHNLHWGPNRDEHYALSDRMFNDHRLEDGVVADSYHIYAIEWDENSIKFFFDDELLNEISLDDPTMGNAFRQPHWLIMDISLYKWEPECVDDTTPFPQSMYVDYVRVYKKK